MCNDIHNLYHQDGGGGEGLSIPRQDIFALLDKNVLSEMNAVESKTSWQVSDMGIDSEIADDMHVYLYMNMHLYFCNYIFNHMNTIYRICCDMF